MSQEKLTQTAAGSGAVRAFGATAGLAAGGVAQSAAGWAAPGSAWGGLGLLANADRPTWAGLLASLQEASPRAGCLRGGVRRRPDRKHGGELTAWEATAVRRPRKRPS